jgi:hypothetical protein
MLLATPVHVMILALRRCVRLVLVALLITAGPASAYGADSYSAGRRSMPSVVIGGATFSDMVANVGCPPPPKMGDAP